MRMNAVVWTGPSQVELQAVDIADPGPGEVLVETLVSAVNPGSERSWLATDAAHFMLGTTFPFVPGYSRVGKIVALGDGVEGWNIGDRVVAAFDQLGRPVGAHASHGLLRASDLDRVPDAVNSLDADYYLLGQTAHFVTSLAGAAPGSEIAIVGAGPIGTLAVQFAREAGCSRIVSLDIVESRRELALQAGATEAIDPLDDEAVAGLLQRGGVSAVVDLSGAESGTNTAIHIAAPGGTVVLSTATGGRMSLEYGELFVKGLRLIGGYVNADPLRAREGTRKFLEYVSDETPTTAPDSCTQAPSRRTALRCRRTSTTRWTRLRS